MRRETISSRYAFHCFQVRLFHPGVLGPVKFTSSLLLAAGSDTVCPLLMYTGLPALNFCLRDSVDSKHIDSVRAGDASVPSNATQGSRRNRPSCRIGQTS